MSAFEYEGNDGDRRLKQISHPLIRSVTPISGGAPAHMFQYQTNALGLVSGITSLNAGGALREQSFLYDKADRLVVASEGARDPVTGATVQASNLYLLDPADNLLGVGAGSSGTPPERTTFFQHNELNQAIQQDGVMRTHDANGNLLSDGRRTYAWDGLDRLVSSSNAADPVVSTWRYDGLSRRAEVNDLGLVQRYRWCGDEICAVLDGGNKVQAWVYGSRGEVNGGRRLVYGEDHLGSVRQVNDAATGQWVLSVSYGLYGEIQDVRCAQSADCRLPNSRRMTKGYAGLYWHGPSGLYLGAYRTYDPKARRWLSRDPIEEAGGLNLYQYVGGNPISLTDPEGLMGHGMPDRSPMSKPAPDDQKTCKRKCQQNRNVCVVGVGGFSGFGAVSTVGLASGAVAVGGAAAVELICNNSFDACMDRCDNVHETCPAK